MIGALIVLGGLGWLLLFLSHAPRETPDYFDNGG